MEVPSRSIILERIKTENKRSALIFPIYYPSALLRSFDIHPFEIWNFPYVDLSLAETHIQSYTCSLGKILLSFIKDPRFQKDYDLIFIPHICDTFQQIGSLLMDFIKPEKPVINFYLPKKDDESAILFCVDELKRMIKILEKITEKSFNEKRLKIEIEKEIEINSLLKDVYLYRDYIKIKDSEFYKIIYSRTYLPADEYISILKHLLNLRDNKKRDCNKKIFLSGISADPLEIFDIINNHNAFVVFDDLAISHRRIFNIENQNADPLRIQSEMMLFTVPDAEKGSPIIKRAKWLIEEAKRTGAKGGIFYIMKFCEPEFFDYPQLKQYLTGSEIRTFLIEYEMSGRISKQNINRLQSFIEGL